MEDLALTLLFVSSISSLALTRLVLKYRRQELKYKEYLKKLSPKTYSKVKYHDLYDVIQEIIALSKRRIDLIDKDLIENRIRNKEELALTLERLLAKTYGYLSCKSVELALYDKNTGVYNTSLLIGKPTSVQAQSLLTAELESAKELEKENIFIEEISFSSTPIGSFRIILDDDQELTPDIKEAIRILSMQAALAIMNAEYAKQLIKLRQAAENSVKARTGFLANLSHEVRGPLGIVLNAVELVLEGLCGDINEEQKETLQMVKGNSEHLLNLINDVLDFAKLESGNLRTRLEYIDLESTLTNLSQVVRGQAKKKSQIISVDIERKVGIICDKRHLRQMLINLLTNAIKYTQDNGKITIGLKIEDNNYVKIFVKDTGIGIEESQMHKVFTVFERVDNEYANKQVGTGLGMPLTKKLAIVNGGSIDFTSKVNEGSEFFLNFKLASQKDKKNYLLESETQLTLRANGEKIVFVDDSEEASIYTKYLESLGFKVDVEFDLDTVIDSIKSKELDLLIIASSYLGENPEKILKNIKEVNHKLPIIILSNKAFDFNIEKYLKFGADLCLIKPLHLNLIAKSSLDLVNN